MDMLLMKEHVVQLPHIDHLAAPAALIEVPFLRFAQLVKISSIHLVKSAGIVEDTVVIATSKDNFSGMPFSLRAIPTRQFCERETACVASQSGGGWPRLPEW
jgi:hypothetical protein